MMALWGFYLRRSSITASSRLVSLALNGLGFAALPAMTPLGRPAEPLCLGGAISRNLPRSPAISRDLPHSPAISHDLPQPPAISRDLPHSPALP